MNTATRPRTPRPPLTPEQRRLAEDNLRLAYHYVSVRRPRLREQFRDLGDATSAALLGLCLAAQGFDPSRGAKFSTHAWHRIAWAVSEAAAQERLVRVPQRGPALRRHALRGDAAAPTSSQPTNAPAVRRLRRAVAQLPDRDRRVVTLRLGGLTMLATAEALAVSKARVSQLEARIVAGLRQILTGEEVRHAA